MGIRNSARAKEETCPRFLAGSISARFLPTLPSRGGWKEGRSTEHHACALPPSALLPRREAGYRGEEDAAELLAGLHADDDDGFGAVAAEMDGEAVVGHGDGLNALARRDGDARDTEFARGARRGPLAHAARALDDDRDDDREAEHQHGPHAADHEFQAADVLRRVEAGGLARLSLRRFPARCCILGHDVDRS